MISSENLFQHVDYLAHTIGTRLAGTSNERTAAEYLQGEFLKYVPSCVIEEFPVLSRRVEHEKLEILIGGSWEEFPATAFNGSPSTNGTPLEADLVFFDSHTDYQRDDLSYLRGKAVIHYGTSMRDYQRLMAAQPAFLLVVDTRYTSTIPLNDGLLPANIQRFGAVPTMDVAFYDAWRWCTEHASRARLTITGDSIPSVSRNVIAELPGTGKNPHCLYISGHIDTAANSPGADDNAIGCAVAVEMARILSERKHKNTIRFLAFGAEEQLSVGSAQYVRRHRAEIEATGRFVCNFDSCGSVVGWNKFVINADTALRNLLYDHFRSHGIYYVEHSEPDPCNDLFPFTVLGVPGITVMRSNCECGKFFHHRPDNDTPVISTEIVASVSSACAALIEQLADCDLAHFYSIEPSSLDAVKALWNNMY